MPKNPYKNRIDRDGRSRGEHVVVWEAANGPVPEGYVIHHKDENKLNNELDNLEAMTHQAHSALHNQKHPLTKLCELCGDEFTPKPTKRERAKTCSWECRNLLLSIKMMGNRNGVGRSQAALTLATVGSWLDTT